MYWMSSQNSPRILFLFVRFFPCFVVPMFFPNGQWLRKNWCEMDFKTFRRFCGEHGESYITIIKDWRATTMVPAEEKPAMETNDYRKINHDKSTVCCSILQLKVVFDIDKLMTPSSTITFQLEKLAQPVQAKRRFSWVLHDWVNQFGQKRRVTTNKSCKLNFYE